MDLLAAYDDDAAEPTVPKPKKKKVKQAAEVPVVNLEEPSSSSSSSSVKPSSLPPPKFALVDAAPAVVGVSADQRQPYRHRPDEKVIYHNPSVESLYAPVMGPSKLPGKVMEDEFNKNCWTGFLEQEHLSDITFSEQYHSFQNTGRAVDPSFSQLKGGTGGMVQNKNVRVQQETEKKTKKRKRKGDDDGEEKEYVGPWGRGREEIEQFKLPEPTPEMIEKYGKKPEGADGNKKTQDFTESSIFHGANLKDYLGRSYVDVPNEISQKVGQEHECYLPKKPIHTWSGHTKGVNAIRFFPKAGHLILSAGMDHKVKIWDVYNKRQCMRTYLGHTGAVRSIDFSNDGKQFLSTGYDKQIKLWDTETGDCISRFHNKKMNYDVKFYPVNNNEFLAACSNNKIIQWDIRANEIVQEYDRHLMAVNTVLFVDEGRRFISTSDDKSIRIWEYGIPVDIKVIQEPHMHSMPSVANHPKGKYFAAQSLDNQILIYGSSGRFSLNKKKRFSGHITAGYACQVNFSPDAAYVVSGSSGGQVFIWDWRTSRILKKLKAHDNVCIGCEWHPVEASRLATCGWDGAIKYWD